ncbi:unnamed protein product [Fusarium graminearum]|uniref:Uncharacterized protein n=1 Tax=Gibberella zeae TaxID=5518 RepID=A0A4U9EUP6_GIBZA|nr:hypothetical protein HG531_006947 [Fusarium graminearum]CAF3463488.1 unnamed protein product [Fusarium graminearum]CAG1963828.1 unnamed protein product [Fusarium graminearum]CAG1982289.1 unnamed protein product [Fusarium graminearum]CAG2015043.1 unnamed protein product [Fusarium graminearum]
MSGLATRLRGPSRISYPGGKKQSETPSHPLPNSKRKLEELSHVREGTLPVSNWLPRHNELRHDAGDDGLIWTQTPSNSDERAGRTSYRTKLPMRSSIACVRCRRSKIKCNNDGGHSPCDHCIKGGHQCQYPEPVPIPPKRSESQAAARSEKEPHPEKKRTRKLDDVPGRNSERSTAYAAEVLAYPFLTTELWSQLLSIYKQHYATELPFIHLPSLKERMISEPGKKQDYPSELNLVLLGILTLTARFHPDLVRYVTHLQNSQQGHTRQRTSQPKNDPVAASDFFATVLTTALGPLRTAMDTITVERVQAFLMLGLFEWSQGHKSAWMYIGVATRMAKMMKLELDDQRMGLLENQAPASQQSRTRSAEIAIVRETRRRTMYSCFILDRLMGHGSGRALSTPTDALWIQLPCSEMAFDLSLHVYTGFLRQPEGFIQPQMNDDSTLSQFIRLIDIWSDISIYISKGGREQENLPPWDNRSRFYELRARLNVFYNGLPDTFTLSRQNYYRHDNHQATNTYVSLHMLASACQIVLNREYLPFLPLRCRGPQGPLDRVQPILDHAPGGFWEESAEQVFLASRNVVDLIELCKDKLPLSSLTTFSIWLAGFMAVYARHFPHMDLKLKMTSQKMLDFAHTSNILEEEMVGTAYQALRRATTYLPAAQNYLDNFEGTNRYFSQMRKPVFQNQEVTRSTGSLDDHVQRMDSAYRHSTSPTLPSIRSTLEDPTKLAGSTSKSQFLLPGVDEEPFEIDIPKSLGRDIEMLESQRMSKVLNDLEGFSGAERLRVVFE